MKRLLAILCTFALLLPLLPLHLTAAETLSTDKTIYTEGEAIRITAVGDGEDWIGIYRKGELPQSVVSIRWYYVAKEGNASGSAKNIFDSEYVNREELATLPAGEYTVYLLADGGYEVISQVDITIKKKVEDMPVEKSISTDKIEYVEGEPILVTAHGEELDWVGLYLPTDTLESDQSIRWYYVAKNGNTAGSAKNIRTAEGANASRAAYQNVPAGDYVIYLCANDKWDVIDSIAITVKESPVSTDKPQAPASVEYSMHKPFPGGAEGKLTITTGEGNLPEGYIAYWGNEKGALTDYTAMAPIACTGKTTVIKIATNTIIPTEADRILIYAKQGTLISEHATEVLLPEGAAEANYGKLLYEMQVVSDIHINASQNHIHNRHFAAALADIQKYSPNSIGIFVNGDIADHGAEAEYRAFQRLIKDAGKLPPVYCAIGNHDLASGPNQEKIDLFLQYTEPGTDSVYFDQWIDDIHFIYLGSEAHGLNAQLSRKQLSWFKKALAENRDGRRPIYVFLHQGLIDTVAGTFAYQNWHGINQAKEFAKILKDYPEVILFSGHSHWEMNSDTIVKAWDDTLPTIVSTSSVAYLWNDDSMATNTGIEGAEGYYIRAYEDKILILGRDFVNGKWIASAQFAIDYTAALPEVDMQTPPTEQAPSTNTLNGSDTVNEDPSGLSTLSIVVGISAVVAVAAAAVALLCIKRKKK